MPGSLLLSNDTYSDLSETSGRSLDSKIGGKKVSFNRAVRVKQYPWKPDSEYNATEHLTLPSNRFWFKVYKNKHETPDLISPEEESFKTTAWAEDNMECIHDSLAPIAEVEDLDVDSCNLNLNSPKDNGYYGTKLQQNGLHSVYGLNNYNHPIEPPVDYLDEREFGSNRNSYNGARTVWKTKEENINSCNSNNVSSMSILNRTYGNHLRILEEAEENAENRFADTAQLAASPMRLPRMPTRENSPLRRSMRNFDTSDILRTRERRSRSHDDHLDNDNRFKLRKADKAVSTEDLNSNHGSSCFTNRFLRGSRDMATQCYGTLTREKNIAPLNGLNTYSSKQKSEEERLNNFKSPSSLRKSFGAGSGFTTSAKVLQLKKESQDQELSKSIRPYDYHTQNNLLSNEKIMNYKKQDQPINGKLSNGTNQSLNRSESSVNTRFQNQNGSPYKSQIKNPDFQSKPPLKGGPRNPKENQTKTIHDSTSLGYLRGRQIPLSEVNTNTNRKYLSRNETPNIRNLFRSENKSTSPTPNGAAKTDRTLSSVLRPKKFVSSNLENSNDRNPKNGSQSAKSYPSSHSENGNSMIDWSLSGFQLAPKPDHGFSSVSDSEYTVHRRPPLLMYIPGVSHHDRPALEDDRLSHLSDLSRSDLNESFGGQYKDRNSTGDLRRRYSMPRDGKLKWMKWRNKE